MKIVVIGGGPAGLYFAILAKKAWPGYSVSVYERNRSDDTFGFGVVFSDETLDHFRAYDENSYHVGDKVKINETRPLSKRKRWRVQERVT